MTVYNATPQDDSNLDVTVTESTDLVTINLTPASFTATGAAVTSVNSKTGAVVLNSDDINEGATNKYLNESIANAFIDTRVDQAFVNALDVDAFTLDGNSSSYFLNYDNFINTPTIPTNNNELTNGAGYITDYTVTESDVTAHEAALSITESQISDLQSYITSYTVTESDVTAHEAALSITESQISDLQSYITSYTVTESDVTAHEAALSITESQISDLQSYITDYTVTEADVTAHEAALTITESQISDLQSYITASSTDTLTNKSGDISQWTNDAGYLTSESDSQTLSFVSPDLTISNGNSVDLSDLVDDSLRSNLSEINFYDAYSFPNSDGNVDQVLTTDGNGALTWEDGGGGGGGGGALDDLTDVTVTSPSDGDIIRYNGTANEFQNTNLGLSLTPTVDFPTSVYKGSPLRAYITNWSSYVDPNAWAQIVDSNGSVVKGASVIVQDVSGNLITTGISVTGTYELQVKVQDFGDLASDTFTQSFDVESFDETYRHYRLLFNSPIANGFSQGTMIVEWEMWTAASQSGTRWPTSGMTSDTAPTPFVASDSYHYGSYAAYKAFDHLNYGGWWNLGSGGSDYTDYLGIDLGSNYPTLKSMMFRMSGSAQKTAQLLGSNTGAFAGEETIIKELYLVPSTSGNNTGRFYIG